MKRRFECDNCKAIITAGQKPRKCVCGSKKLILLSIQYIDEKEKAERETLKEEILTHLIRKEKDEATERIVRFVKDNSYIYTIRDDEHQEMWIYDEGIYVPQAKTYIKELCREVLGEVYTTHFLNQVLAKIEADTYIKQEEFFTNEDIEEVALKNGVLNLKTKKLTEFTPEKRFFNKIPVTYNPEMECPAITKHFETILKHKEDVPLMFEFFGNLLWKEYRIEKSVMFSGNGRNGKGKTLELMKRFVGVENCANVSIQHLESDIFAPGELFNKMANLSGDLSKTALTNTGMFKNVTGRDLISAPRKFLPRIHFTNYAKMVFACNELPRVYDNSVAFWVRWVLVEFPYEFVDEGKYNSATEEERKMWKINDPEIIKKLCTEDELSGLLNKALDGLDKLFEQNDFSYSKSTQEVKELWARKADSFQAFLLDFVEEAEDNTITKKDLRKEYFRYCKKHHLRNIASDKSIGNTLVMNFGVCDERNTVEGKQVWCWVGIKYKEKENTESKGSKGIPPYRKKDKFPLGIKPLATLTPESNLCVKCKKNPGILTQNGVKFYCEACGKEEFGGEKCLKKL